MYEYVYVQAELLRLGGAEVKIEYLELFDDGIGPEGYVSK